MKPTFDYKILTNPVFVDLEDMVLYELRRGYIPVGGVSFDYDQNYIQAVYKKDDDE